jgi:short-subunit dehydrogenase
MMPRILRSAASSDARPLDGRTVVITGASTGIGEAAARKLARRGAVVCLIARRADLLDQLVARIEADGGTAIAYPVDLTDSSATDAVVKQILADHTRVDVLINNAGRSIRRSITDSVDRLHDYERTMSVNYLAAVQLTLGFLPRFREQGHGHVVFSSTMSTQFPVPLFSAYVASKAALESFAHSLNAELGHRNITSTVVNFPLVRTDMSGPTKVYQSMRMMSPERAGAWLVKAAETRPVRLSLPFGLWGELNMAIAPGFTTAVTPRVVLGRERRIAQRSGDE